MATVLKTTGQISHRDAIFKFQNVPGLRDKTGQLFGRAGCASHLPAAGRQRMGQMLADIAKAKNKDMIFALDAILADLCNVGKQDNDTLIWSFE